VTTVAGGRVVDVPGGERLVLEGRSTDGREPLRITIDGSRISAIERIDDAVPEDLWIAPGWLDLQVNGYAGHDPNAADADAGVVAAMVESIWRTGVSGSCVTICTE